MITPVTNTFLGSLKTMIDAEKNLTFNTYKVDPFFYTLKDIHWDLFLTCHYKGADHDRDTDFAEKNRSVLIASLFRRSKNALGLASNDIQYFGTTEKINSRCHTHTLIHIKRKAPVGLPELRAMIQSLIPWDIVTIPESSTKEKANQIVNDPEAVAAYISKLNRNDLDMRRIHFSKEFIRFAGNCGKSAI